MNQGPLSGRIALVTGGGRGAGAVVARSLADAGAAVAVTARTEAEIGVVAARLTERGADAWAFPADVSSPESVEALKRVVLERAGRVDILVNNAGVSFAAPLTRTSHEDWQRVLAVNATGTFLCARAFLPGMLAERWGRVVNIASVAGLSGDRYISAYAASKHAVVGFTRAVAAEVALKGVTVNAICPTYVDTEMTEATLGQIEQATGRNRQAALEAILGRTPQKRLVTPEEVGATVVFLCGEAARGITGEALAIDGGELRR